MKRFVSVISVAFVVAVFTPFALFAQDTSCKATISSLPAAAELKGLRLGMTMEQVKAQVPQITFGPTDELGSSKTTINPKFDPRTEAGVFQDVRSVSLDFLDERLVSLWIGYDSNFKWTTVDEFVNGISTSLQLPKTWSTWKVRGKELTCSDFQLTVTLVAQSPSFRVLDRASEETLTARRIAKEEETEARLRLQRQIRLLNQKLKKLSATARVRPITYQPAKPQSRLRKRIVLSLRQSQKRRRRDTNERRDVRIDCGVVQGHRKLAL